MLCIGFEDTEPESVQNHCLQIKSRFTSIEKIRRKINNMIHRAAMFCEALGYPT